MDHDAKQHATDTVASKRLYRKSHFGVQHGIRPLLPLDPMKYVGCCLHLLLSVTGTLWVHGVLAALGGSSESKRKCELMNEKLRELRISL